MYRLGGGGYTCACYHSTIWEVLFVISTLRSMSVNTVLMEVMYGYLVYGKLSCTSKTWKIG
jgi:hypothetical protein